MYIIETKDVNYYFKKNEAVLNSISLHVKKGSIYGFLGPNGAGKTTTLRLILGLLKKQKGEVLLFGKPIEQNRVELLRGVGSLIESPSIYGQLTAEENLLVWQKVYQCPKTRIPETLQLVGLGHTGQKKAGQFSLGMKQRLAIAIALLHSPQLLILDEPTNGLDPSGIVEIRELFKSLNRERGITILISSHLLTEIEKMVTDVGIIHRGNMLFEGSLDALKQRQYAASSIVIETNRSQDTMAIIAAQHPVTHIKEGKVVLPNLPKTVIAAINQQLVAQGIEVYSLQTVEDDLEHIFMNLTR
jgi:lantibiotic transport system ATP-binding protein